MAAAGAAITSGVLVLIGLALFIGRAGSRGVG